jgi:beta-fructofuranosidase
LLYRPPDAWVGDVIPFFADGAFHVFYLWDDRDARGAWRGLDWAHLASRDLVTFEELPLAVPRGGPDDLDLIAGTGCVMPDPDGGWVIYYAGINPSNPARGFPEQVVLRSTSPDLVTWTKDPDWVLQADPRWYEANDWRDPFIHPDGHGGWNMLLCARVNDGPSDRRGTFALATSPDMKQWTVMPPAYTPGTTRAPECPDLFEMDGRWYLLYAGFSDRFATRYVVGPSPDGPWATPVHDALEAPDVYAMKTVFDGTDRYLLGWLATRAGERDTGHRQWGGDLLAHRLFARSDGTLGVGPVRGLLEAFDTPGPTTPAPRYGTWESSPSGHHFAGHGIGYLRLGDPGPSALLDVTLDLRGDPDEVAVVLRADVDLDRAYHLRLEPRRGRFVFDRRPHHIFIPFAPENDRAYVDARDFEIERPLVAPDGIVRVQVILDGSAIVAYVNGVALSTRGYDLAQGEWGVLAVGGTVTITGVSAARRKGAVAG